MHNLRQDMRIMHALPAPAFHARKSGGQKTRQEATVQCGEHHGGIERQEGHASSQTTKEYRPNRAGDGDDQQRRQPTLPKR
jgi:hypothetical protein